MPEVLIDYLASLKKHNNSEVHPCCISSPCVFKSDGILGSIGDLAPQPMSPVWLK